MAETKPSSLGQDQADLMTAVIGIWMAVNELQRTLPPEPAEKVAAAMSNVSQSLGRILARHDISVSATYSELEPTHE